MKGKGKQKGEKVDSRASTPKNGGMSKGETKENDKRIEGAVEFVVKKNYPKALEILESVFRKESEADWYTKGNILMNMKDLDGALKCYDKAIALDPNYVKAWYRKGWALISKKELVRAIACFDRVIEIEGWLDEAIARSRKTEDYNHLLRAVAEKRQRNNSWSQAALITRTYLMMVDANARATKKDMITDAESKKIKENLVYAYTILKVYPVIAPRLPQLGGADFVRTRMPDFILLNLTGILNAIEPPVVFESRVKKK